MGETSEQVHTLCALPGGAVPLDVIEVCCYLDTAGDRKYIVRYTTAAPLSTLIGLLRVAEHQMLHEASQQWAAGEEDQ